MPDSIFKEIERFAGQIGAITQKAITSEIGAQSIAVKPEELAAIWRGKDKREPFGRIQKEWRDYSLYWAMKERLNRGMTIEQASEDVHNTIINMLAPKTIENIWKRLNTDG